MFTHMFTVHEAMGKSALVWHRFRFYEQKLLSVTV